MSSIYEKLLEYANTLDIVDSHEHLFSEETHIKRYISFFDLITSYLNWDLYGAGMPMDYVWKYPQSRAEEIKLFKVIEPFWKYVKYGSYARPAKLALKEFYGYET